MPFTTEAFVLEQVNSDFKLETIELDDPQDEEVLVEGEQRKLCLGVDMVVTTLILCSRCLRTLSQYVVFHLKLRVNA